MDTFKIRITGQPLTASELANLMLQWEAQKQILEDIEEAIKTEVLAVGKTVDAGNVRASYSKGRRTFDYTLGGKIIETAPRTIIAEHTVNIEKIDWKAVCEDMQIADIPFTTTEPSVTLKLKE